MASITLKDLPEELHGQLTLEAEANFRSLSQEILARLQRSFEIDTALKTKSDQRLIDEALASGPEEPLTRAKLNEIKRRILGPRKS